MDILQLFIEYFGIDLLNDASTFTDLISLILEITIAMFLVCFVIRSLFYLVRRY